MGTNYVPFDFKMATKVSITFISCLHIQQEQNKFEFTTRTFVFSQGTPEGL